jgi:hypothetical protein
LGASGGKKLELLRKEIGYHWRRPSRGKGHLCYAPIRCVSALNTHILKDPHSGARQIVLHGIQNTPGGEGRFNARPRQANSLEGETLRCYDSSRIGQCIETMALQQQ